MQTEDLTAVACNVVCFRRHRLPAALHINVNWFLICCVWNCDVHCSAVRNQRRLQISLISLFACEAYLKFWKCCWQHKSHNKESCYKFVLCRTHRHTHICVLLLPGNGEKLTISQSVRESVSCKSCKIDNWQQQNEVWQSFVCGDVCARVEKLKWV